MGNSPSVYQELVDEFNSLKQEKNRNYLVLEDILKFKSPREYPIDKTHLGTLFVMDQTKDGKFYVQEIVDFAALYSERQLMHSGVTVDFLKEFQGFCTIQMWNVVSRPNGDQVFTNWFNQLFSLSMTSEVPSAPGKTFITKDAIKVLHEILNIEKTYGVEFPYFFDLMQRTAEEREMMNLVEEELDEVIPLEILKSFAKDFIDGFLKYMRELGFEEDMEIP